jgi:hypothetical protein
LQEGSAEVASVNHNRLNAVSDLLRLDETGPVGLVVDLTYPELGAEEETQCQARLLDAMLAVCSVSLIVFFFFF